MRGHTIVCGDDALTVRIIDELVNAEMRVVQLQSPAELDAADVAGAHAVICASDDDAANLEIALLARQANSRVRVVSRLSNAVLREALAERNGPGAVLDVADLAAPSVVEACLGRATHTIAAAGIEFVVSGEAAKRDGTLRELYRDLAPVAIVRAETSDTPGELIACPGRDVQVQRGDWTVVIGTPDELANQGIPIAKPMAAAGKPRSRRGRFADAIRVFLDDLNPMFYRALGASATLLLGSTVILRYSYRQPGMGWVDALYFSAETIATVGYGDFNFSEQAIWLRLWSIVMMLAGVATTAIVVAFVADALLSRRLSQSASLQKVRHLNRHIVVVGLGSFGIQVATILKSAGHDVAVVESNEDSRYLSAAAELDVPVIFGDATLSQTLQAARVGQARAIAVLTQDDMINIETGMVLREILAGSKAPIVLRIYDRALGSAVGHRFGFEYVRSTVDLAAPWFIGAAMGLDVLGTFSVGQRSFMVGGVLVRPGSELDGITMSELSTQTRVIAIASTGQSAQVNPRRDTRLTAGDTAYLVGPYRELLDTLRKGASASSSS